jgi:hypothetical protein
MNEVTIPLIYLFGALVFSFLLGFFIPIIINVLCREKDEVIYRRERICK